MANNGISFNCRRRQITIRVRDYVEVRTFLGTLKRKLPELKVLYGNGEPELISIIASNFTEKEHQNIKKVIAKVLSSEVRFIRNEELGLSGIRKAFNKEIAVSKTTFERHSLRSGQKVEFDGSIVVLGDVHSGAEVVAGENIIVLGTLRGLAHAGARGNREAIISADSIEASQIRISNVIRHFDSEEINGEFIKTNAYLNDDDKIIVE